jgi:RNA polymerase sigma-70 factor (ECF subfamily)
MLADPNEADEVTQDTFLKIWTSAGRWKPTTKDSQVLPWLRTIVMNACIDRLRRRRFNEQSEIPDRPDEGPTAADEIDRLRIGALVEGALGQLPDRQRAAIVLTYFEELSNSEAAAAMDMHLKAFESLLLRARYALKTSIANAGIGPADLREVA